MNDENKLEITSTFREACEQLRTKGYADIATGGGDDWNQRVASRLSRDLNTTVLLVGPSPQVDSDRNVYRYTLEATNNRGAALLLSQSDD